MMEDRRYRGGNSRDRFRGERERERERDYSPRRMNEGEDNWRYLPRGREFDVVGEREREREYRGMDRRGGGGGRGREYDRTRVADPRASPTVVRDAREGRGGGGREYDRMRVGDPRVSPGAVRDGGVEHGGEYDRMRVGDRRVSPMVARDYGVERRGGGREYDGTGVGDRRVSPMVGGVERGSGGREYDRRRSPTGVRDGREDRGDGGGEYGRMRAGDQRVSPMVVRDGGVGREYDRRHSVSPMVVRDGREDRGGIGREYDRMRVDDRRFSATVGRDGWKECSGGREYDGMRVDDRRHSPRGREVEGVIDGRESRGGGRERDKMRVGDWKHSPRGRQVEGVRDGREDYGVCGRECDRMRAGHWGRSPRGREVEVVRDGRDHQKGRFNDGEYSMGRREISATWSVGEHERQIVHSQSQLEMKTTCIGDVYEERIAESKYSLMRREIEGMRSGKGYEGSRMPDQESPMFPVVENKLMDEHIPDQVMLRREDYDRVPPDVPNRGRDYDGALPDVANRMRDYDRTPPDVANRMRDYGSAPPDVANRMKNYDKAPPDVAIRGRDYDRALPDVAYRGSDYDRAPPDVANRSRDDDGGLPWSMILSRDDRGIETDNGNNNGLLERNCYQFDDSLPSMGSTSLKFQNNMLEDRWKADTFRSNRECGVSDARLCNDGDNFCKQSLDVGLLERFNDCDSMLLTSDNGRRLLSSCPSDSISKHFGVASHLRLLTPHPDNADHKHVDLHGVRDLDKLAADRAFREDRNTLELSENGYDYIPSSSLSKAFSTMSSYGYREELPPYVKETDNIGSGGVVLSCGFSDKPLMYDRHGEKSLSGSSIIYGRQSNDNNCYSRSCFTLPEEHKSSAHQEVGRSDDNHICAGSCSIDGKSLNFVEDCCCQVMPRAQNMELKMDRENYQFSKRHRSSDGSQQWDLDPYSIRNSMPDYVSAVRSSHLKKKDMDILEYGNSHLQYDGRIHDDFGPNQHLENHDHRKNDGSHCHHDESEIMRLGKYCSNLDGCDCSPTQNSCLHPNSSQPSEMMLRHSHLTGNLQSARQTNDGIYVKEPYGDDELDFLAVSKKSRSSRSEKTGNGCRDLSSELTNRKLSQPLATVSSKDTRSSGRDIKSRLGPCPQDAHTSRSVAKKIKPSVKKRLGHGPNKLHVTLPWIKNLNPPKLSRIETDSDRRSNKRNHDQGEEISEGNGSSRRVNPMFNAPKLTKFQQGSEGFLDQLGDNLEANEIFRKGEPPENSGEFKQLVHSNFFKFVKQLNETLVRRRKFMENGKCGSLKCLVCGSDSPEFQDTESLVMHALSCDKIGSKCKHLGFHKALCALMGWRSAEVLNDSWACERLTDAETLALKDDLIIWPPAVVVHNITIADIPEKRITLSVEEFEGRLRDMGFCDKTKVSHGRPANQGTMVVSFGPTFSALQEAERLHKIFLDFNRGRTGVLQLNSNSSDNCPGELPVASGDELHPFLYGYIGLADDLDKLDFEIKRRSLIKSKMEIQVTEDALAKKEVTVDDKNKKGVIADATVN